MIRVQAPHGTVISTDIREAKALARLGWVVVPDVEPVEVVEEVESPTGVEGE